MRAKMKRNASEIDSQGSSQTVKAQVQLRDLVLSGELEPGTRVAELAIVERLGVSRTPIRAALARLQEEGLLEALPSGGYMVKSFSDADIKDAIELRGTLEGLAARFAAERGIPQELLEEARTCLDRIDDAIADTALSEANFSIYVTENDHFHTLLREMSGSPSIRSQIERMMHTPFASPSAFVKVNAAEAGSRDLLVIAQNQHRNMLDAIRQREGTRAEAITREHARISQRQFTIAIANRNSFEQISGANLFRLHSVRL